MPTQSLSFVTGKGPQLIVGQVVLQSPGAGETNVATTVQPYFQLNVPFNPISVTPATVYVSPNYCGYSPTPGTVTLSADHRTATISPSAALTPQTWYYVCSSATDVTGNLVSVSSQFMMGN